MRYFFFLEREGRGWTKGEFVLKSGDSLLWHEKKTEIFAMLCSFFKFSKLFFKI